MRADIWLDEMLHSKHRKKSSYFSRTLKIASQTMRDVMDGGVRRGRAAISFNDLPNLEIGVVSGFSIEAPSISGGEGQHSKVVGFIESLSSGPRRGAGNYRVRESVLTQWA